MGQRAEMRTDLLSDRLIAAYRLSGRKQVALARAIGMPRPTLCSWLNRTMAPRLDDERVLRLGQLLGVPLKECFDSTSTEAARV